MEKLKPHRELVQATTFEEEQIIANRAVKKRRNTAERRERKGGQYRRIELRNGVKKLGGRKRG